MADPLKLLDAARRGKPTPEESFDLDTVYGTLKRLVKKYRIKYTPQDPVPRDDALADRVFQAAVDFFVGCGVFFKDKQTVVRFSRDEALAAVKSYRGECRFGDGAEARVFRARKPDSATRPWCHVGSGIVASSEEIASQTVWGYASIAAADSMSVSALDEVDGHPVVAGEPTEIRAAMRSIRVARAACARAGRPGLPIINGVAAAVSVTGTIAASNPTTGWRRSDGIIVGSLAEFKTNTEMMAKVTWIKESGCNLVLASAPILGGYGGGPEAIAILNAACALFGIVVYECDYYLSLPMHIHYNCSTSRDILWAVAVSSQAISRNTNLPTLSLPYNIGGPMTELFYYESAASIIAAVVSGVSTQTPHPARAVLPDHITPLDARVCVEMELGAAGMSRKEASPIVDRVLERYEDRLGEADNGKSYTQCFDLKSGKPTSEHVKFVERVKRDLAGLGVPFKEAVR